MKQLVLRSIGFLRTIEKLRDFKQTLKAILIVLTTENHNQFSLKYLINCIKTFKMDNMDALDRKFVHQEYPELASEGEEKGKKKI